MVRLVALSLGGAIFGCDASQNALEEFISEWVVRQMGTRYGSGECTALLEGAEDAAKTAGFTVPRMTGGCYSDTSIYCWSDTEISLNEIQPGDFVQFHNWDERFSTGNGHRTKDAHHHSAVIRETYDGSVLKVWEQNQFGAEPNGMACEGIYHPNEATGDLHVFRMGAGSGPAPNPTPTPTPSPRPSPRPSPSPSPSPASCTDKSGWKNQDGDTCNTYAHNNYCTSSGGEGSGWRHGSWGDIKNFHDSAGDTAMDACCACGGSSGSNPSSQCTDKSGWKNQDGDTCNTYAQNNYCTSSGGEGSGWRHGSWGDIKNFHDSAGDTAMDACCACGGNGHTAVIV